MTYRKHQFLWLGILFLFLLISILHGSRQPTTTTPIHAMETELKFFRGTEGVKGSEITTGRVRVLCFEDAVSDVIVADLVLDLPTRRHLPANCKFVAAMREWHPQESGKPNHGPAFWIYSTSWNPRTWESGTSKLADVTKPIIIRDEWTLTLFNVVASLAWEPANDSAVTTVADIREGIEKASQALYDATDGHMAFGPVKIYTNGQNWEGADLRFLAANDKKPSVYVGGIVPDVTAVPAVEPDGTTYYSPAGMYYGRLWDGHDAHNPTKGQWKQSYAYRTILHEWAHYALFLYDEYQDTDTGKSYCLCDDLKNPDGCIPDIDDPGHTYGEDIEASVMAYPYNASEFWHGNAHSGYATDNCENTWQYAMYPYSDWKYLADQWQGIQNIEFEDRTGAIVTDIHPFTYDMTFAFGSDLLSPGLVEHLFGRDPGHTVYLPIVLRDGDSPPDTFFEPTVELRIEDAPFDVGTPLASQIYLLEGGISNPTRILYQGKTTDIPSAPTVGTATILGAKPDDGIVAFTDQYASPADDPPVAPTAQYIYPPTVLRESDLRGGITLNGVKQSWQYILETDFESEAGLVKKLNVRLRSINHSLTHPEIQICAMDAKIGCAPAPEWQQTMRPKTISGKVWWVAEFTHLPGERQLPRHLILRIQTDKGEIIRWVQASGGVGPGHVDADAPLLDDIITVNTSNDVVIPQNQNCNNYVSFMPAANSEAVTASNSLGIITTLNFVGTPLDITILIPLNANTCPTVTPGLDTSLPGVYLTFSYGQDQIDQLIADGRIIDENSLHIYHYFQASGFWDAPQEMFQDTDLNWISAFIQEDGIYAIGWEAPP